MSQLSNQFAQSVEKGKLDLRFNPNTIPCQVKSGESTPLVPGQAVKLVDSAGGVPKVTAITADTDEIFGIIPYHVQQSSFAAGEPVEVAAQGNVVYMEASAAIARGAKVMAVVTGSKIATATAGKTMIGFAFDKAATNGDLIRVYLNNYAFSVLENQAAFVAQLSDVAAMTGTVTGGMVDVADIALSTGNSYSDAAVNGAVNTAVGEANLQLKELATKINAIQAALVASGLMAAS